MSLMTKKVSLSAFSWCAAAVSAGLEDGREGWARWIVLVGSIFFLLCRTNVGMCSLHMCIFRHTAAIFVVF